MELRHLRYFCAVADHGTFREASRHLHISQSAISEQIADLEDEVGGPLLDRAQRTARLTAQGRIFLEEARKTLRCADRAVDVTRRSLLGQEGELSIGFFSWGAGGFVPRLIREYRRLHPTIKLSLFEMHTSVQMDAFESGRIDVGFTRPLEPPYSQALRDELLYNDPVVAVLPSDHPLAAAAAGSSGTGIDVKALSGERLVMVERAVSPALFDNIVSLCASAGFFPNIVNSSATWSGVLTLVEAGEGIALVPSGCPPLPLPGPDLLPACSRHDAHRALRRLEPAQRGPRRSGLPPPRARKQDPHPPLPRELRKRPVAC